MPDYIFDTTVLSNFASTGHIDLIGTRYAGVAYTTVEVADDLAARRLAETNNVPLSGTLGMLIALVRHDALSLKEANAILTTMILRNYRSPVDRLDELI